MALVLIMKHCHAKYSNLKLLNCADTNLNKRRKHNGQKVVIASRLKQKPFKIIN